MVSKMLDDADTTRIRITDSMSSFRIAVLVTIAFLAFLMVLVALVAAIWDVSDRGLGVIGIVLTALTSLVGSVIVYLKIDNVEAKADHAANKADAAAKIGAEVHHDIRNDVVKDKVRQALAEERHMLAQRETVQLARAQMEQRVRERDEGQSG